MTVDVRTAEDRLVRTLDEVARRVPESSNGWVESSALHLDSIHDQRRAVASLVRRTRRRPLVIAAAMVIAVIVAAMALLQTSMSDRSVRVPAQEPDPGPPAISVRSLSSEQIEAALMPATNADFDLTRQLLSYRNVVFQVVLNSCLAGEGYPEAASDTAPVIHPHQRYRYFENPASIREIGLLPTFDPSLSVTVDVPPDANASSDTETAAPREVEELCGQRVGTDLAPLVEQLNIFFEWAGREVPILDQSPAMAAAWDGWRECMADGGYPAASEDELFGTVQRVVGEGRVDQMSISTAYADCLDRGIVQARAAVRSAGRADFVAKHQATWDSLANLNAVIREMSTKYGVSFPVT